MTCVTRLLQSLPARVSTSKPLLSPSPICRKNPCASASGTFVRRIRNAPPVALERPTRGVSTLVATDESRTGSSGSAGTTTVSPQKTRRPQLPERKGCRPVASSAPQSMRASGPGLRVPENHQQQPAHHSHPTRRCEAGFMEILAAIPDRLPFDSTLPHTKLLT